MVTQRSLPFSSGASIRLAQPGLQQIVDGLSETAEIALARIWVIQSREFCEICQSEPTHAPADEPCLHLVASAGRSRDAAKPEVWNRLSGAFHRFSLNSQKIGRIAATGEPLLVHHSKNEAVLAHPDWLIKEGIQSFFGYPLAKEDDVSHEVRILGVMAVFSRRRLTEHDLRFLRQIADGGARLFEDAATLTEQDRRLQRLQSEIDCLRADLEIERALGPLVVCGPASRKLDSQISMAAAHSHPVLISGARGTGKAFTARLIHSRSRRQTDPFGKLDGASLTIDLLKKFAAAGTLLIKDVEQTPLDVQERLAEELLSTTHVANLHAANSLVQPARITATSRVDLQAEVAAGRLRRDLYCALSVVEIEVPSLSERAEDLPVLAAQIIRDICRRENRPALELNGATLARLMRYDWPGNARELQVVLECAIMQSQDDVISLDGYLHLNSMEDTGGSVAKFVRADELKQQERANILKCLKRCGWKVYGAGGAAEMLGVKPTTLLYRMKVLRIRKPSKQDLRLRNEMQSEEF